MTPFQKHARVVSRGCVGTIAEIRGDSAKVLLDKPAQFTDFHVTKLHDLRHMKAFEKHIERRRLRRMIRMLQDMNARVVAMGPCHLQVVGTTTIQVGKLQLRDLHV